MHRRASRGGFLGSPSPRDGCTNNCARNPDAAPVLTARTDYTDESGLLILWKLLKIQLGLKISVIKDSRIEYDKKTVHNSSALPTIRLWVGKATVTQWPHFSRCF